MANPLNINNKIYINLEIKPKDKEPLEWFQLDTDNFERVAIVTECDNFLPICEVEFKLPSYTLLQVLSKSETTFILTAANIQENVEEPIEFRLTNFKIEQRADGKINYTLYGIMKSDEYDKDIKIRAFKDKNSHEVLKELENKEIELDKENLFEAKDKQTWIQHNCTEKELVTRVLKNAYIEDGDAPIAAINLDKKLRVLSIKKAFENADKQKKKWQFWQEKKEINELVIFEKYTISTNRGIIQKAFIDDRQQPVIDMFNKDKSKETSSWLGAILSSFGLKTEDNKSEETPSGTYGAGTDYPILINAGNCHANYYKAFINNIKAKALLHTLNIEVPVGSRYFKDSELKILDIVEFHPTHISLKPIEELEGNYMVTKKVIEFKREGFNTTVTLSRMML